MDVRNIFAVVCVRFGVGRVVSLSFVICEIFFMSIYEWISLVICLYVVYLQPSSSMSRNIASCASSGVIVVAKLIGWTRDRDLLVGE